MPVVWQQQVFALDVKYNSSRAKNMPSFRTLYIRRRNQLLRENSRNSKNGDIWKQYFNVRGMLLQNKYGPAFDFNNLRKLSTSTRVSPDISLSAKENVTSVYSESDIVMPTRIAEASRAIVGDNSVSDNYAFAGVHHIFDQHSASIPMVKFANNNRSRLCCVSYDHTLSICDVSHPPKVECILRFHSQPVTGCDWSAANELIASCSIDGFICLWDTKSYSCLRSVSGGVPCPLYCCLFHPVNNNYVLAGNGKGNVEVLNVSTGLKQQNSVGGKVLSLAFEYSGNLIWAGNDQGVILSFSFDMVSGKMRKLRRIFMGEAVAITSINYGAWVSREARDPSLLVNLAANTIRLYSVADKQGSLILKRRYYIKHKSNNLPIHSTFCPIISFREGACVVSGSEDSNIYFLDVNQQLESKALVNQLQGHSSPVLGVSFNYDESLLATSDLQGLLIIWKRDAKTRV